MSTVPPPLQPQAAPRATHTPDGAPKFISPLAKSILVVCIVSAISWAGCAVLAVVLHQWAWLQELTAGSDLSWMPPSLLWFGRHAVAVNLAMTALCVAGAVSCWGLLRRLNWALQLFIVLLVLTAVLNFFVVWVVDDIFRQLALHLPAAVDDIDQGELRSELVVQRILYTGISLATAVSFAVLHAWLLVRLRRPDVKAWFAR
ncbi:hypothetical protein [Stenotrophomonas sp. 278]|uniref:hypothetical protein n=1 Tax=Stenotrophomonas sp. 278 TaxID=2479851 RepID=UPI000F668333|nr:hypothetical protein [Stenotrophomonas sp. 278]RRU02640.1 hypothetical protein EGJ34_19980 [Stenotrophomonas sp. 278]